MEKKHDTKSLKFIHKHDAFVESITDTDLFTCQQKL